MHKVVPKVGDLIPEPKLEHKNVIRFDSYSFKADDVNAAGKLEGRRSVAAQILGRY